MDPPFDPDSDVLSENSWGRSWEDQLLEDFSSEKDTLDQQSKIEQEAAAQNLWMSFQNSASAVTNLYKGKYSVCCSRFQWLLSRQLSG
mgnify:CR=1 FL=1